jgi:hypothetical protein
LRSHPHPIYLPRNRIRHRSSRCCSKHRDLLLRL